LNSEDSGTGETVLKRKPARTSTKKGKSTLGAQFKQQLTTLMDTLNATEPHFVRCMKPNMEKIGRKFSSTVMLSQLRYAGLLEVCRIRQMGFPNRMPFEKFLRQYLVLQPSASSPQMLAELLSSSGQLPSSQYVIGNSKVFMKHSAATLLDSLRDKAYFVVATKTQKVARGYLKRKRFALFKKTLTNLNKSVTEKNQPLLEDAVASAIELPYEGVHIAIVKTAKDLLRRLKEENKVKKLLQDAIEDRQLAALEGALRTAKSMNPPLEDDLVSQAGSLIQLIKEEKQHLSSAASLIKVRELDSLEDWMDKAEQLNLLASDEARSVQALIDRINDENGLLEELENAIASENLQTLSAYLTKATEMGLDDRPVFIEAKKCQHHLEELSAGKRALEISLESPDLDSLMSSMEKARACGVSNEEPLFLKAQHLHSLLSQVNEIEAALKVSIDNASLEDLSEQVQAAQNILLLVQGESALAAMNIEIHGISTAEALISSLTKKKQDDESELAKQDEVAEQIRCALQDKEFSYLRGLIAQAKGMGLSQGKYASLIKEADHVLETMRIAMDKEMALVAAIRMKDVSALNNAITKAQSGDTATVPGSLASAIRLRDELVAQGSIVEEIKAAVESKNILILPELLQRAEQSNLTNRCVDDAKILLEREGNRNQIYKQLVDAQDQQSLSEALEKAIQIGLNNDIVEAARLRYDKMKDSTSAVEELKSAMRNLDVIRVSENGLSESDIAPLKFALSQVGSSDDSGLGPLVKEAEDTLARAQKQLELQATLSNITESTPIVEIKKSLRTSADAGIKNYIGQSDHRTPLLSPFLSLSHAPSLPHDP
jgi:myosin heavy subunit